MNDFLIHGYIPVTLYSNMLNFRDCNKFFKLDGHLLKTTTNNKFNAGHFNLHDQKIIREFAEEMKFDNKNKGRKSPRDHQLSWNLEFPHFFHHPILMNYVTD